MKTTTKNTGIKVTASVKAGGLGAQGNHNRSGIKVRSAIKGGELIRESNHSNWLIAIN